MIYAVAHLLENTLKDWPYLLGDDFSGADILFGGTFAMFGQSPIMPQSAAIADYAKRCVVRPAFARRGEGQWLRSSI
ncbi:MAG: glutathione S-transferase C-terminal domain-containing protein [Alphaproteobacteria bacterium]